MKICTKCGKPKSTKDFFTRDSRTGRLHSQCKECYKKHRLTYQKEHYQKYRNQYLDRANKRRKIISATLHTQLQQYLSGKKCIVCGESDPVVLDFDHVDPKVKQFSISRGISNGKKWPEILNEIQKCQILCANCHKRKTATEQNWHKLSKSTTI